MGIAQGHTIASLANSAISEPAKMRSQSGLLVLTAINAAVKPPVYSIQLQAWRVHALGISQFPLAIPAKIMSSNELVHMSVRFFDNSL